MPCALAVASRYNTEHTLLGNVHNAITFLIDEIERLSTDITKKRDVERMQKHSQEIGSDHLDCMHHGSVDGSFRERNDEPSKPTGFADEMWDAMQLGDWMKLRKEEFEGFRVDRTMNELSDVGYVNNLWASLCLKLAGGSRTLYSERWGTLGCALNASVTAILAQPSPDGAVVLTGETGLPMFLQELATFQQMKRPGDKLLCVVFDNAVMGRAAFGFKNTSGCDVVGPNYVTLGKAYGGDGILLDGSDKAEEVTIKTMEAEGLFIVHAMVIRPSRQTWQLSKTMLLLS